MEGTMPDDDFQDLRDLKPSYTFIGTSPAAEHLEVARIHYREAKQMEDNAQIAEAEGRLEEAKLLKDLAKSRRETAQEFERAARGEGGDPIVTDILSDQEDMNKNFVPHESKYVVKLTAEEEAALASLAEVVEPPPPGPIARAVAWFNKLGR
jgi:hypothetical protein